MASTRVHQAPILYSVRGAAEALSLSADKVYKLIDAGLIEAVRIPGVADIRIPAHAITDYVMAGEPVIVDGKS